MRGWFANFRQPIFQSDKWTCTNFRSEIDLFVDRSFVGKKKKRTKKVYLQVYLRISFFFFKCKYVFKCRELFHFLLVNNVIRESIIISILSVSLSVKNNLIADESNIDGDGEQHPREE